MSCTIEAPCGGVLVYDQWHQTHKDANVPGMARCINGHTFLDGTAHVIEEPPKPEGLPLCGRHRIPRPCERCHAHWLKWKPLMNAKRRKAQ